MGEQLEKSWADGNALHLDYGDGCITVHLLKITEFVHLKWTHFLRYENYTSTKLLKGRGEGRSVLL